MSDMKSVNDIIDMIEQIDPLETFDLDIDIISNAAGEEQLNYSPHDKINLMSILQIIRDAYYISTIQKRKGIDKAG